ncbi:leucine-rich repeat-containing protein 72-like [Ciona intestinalis]
MSSNQVVNSLLKKQQIKQDSNVVELYLGKLGLSWLSSLGRFRFLQRLWLNSNQIKSLVAEDGIKQSFLRNNHRITELYLQNNELSDVTGGISHLRYLQVLMLQKNQLVNLNAILHEVSTLQALRVLNLFDNPVAQEAGYRLLVIHHLPSVALLDREGVTSNERKKCRQIHEPEREEVMSSIAFGRRAGVERSLERYVKSHDQCGTTHVRKEAPTPPSGRHNEQSLMCYTTMDWSRVALSEQRRFETKIISPENLIVKFH